MHVETEIVYKLVHLKDWSNCRPHEGTALAVIGHPIAHSLSPVMHNAALAELGKTTPEFNEWRYFKFDIAPEELREALDLFHQNNFLGLNLTVPHKALVLEYIHTDVTAVEESGAANTLKHSGKGWMGFNTDGYGLNHALEDESVSIPGADVILLGAGGAARAAALECLAWRCASLRIQNRTRSTIHSLISHLKKSTALAGTTELIPFDSEDSELGAGAIVINATSLGLKAEDESPLDLTKIPRPAFVFDMIYRPAQTALLLQATKLGIKNANGLSMLVHQGAASLELWTGEKAPIPTMQQAVRAALS